MNALKIRSGASDYPNKYNLISDLCSVYDKRRQTSITIQMKLDDLQEFITEIIEKLDFDIHNYLDAPIKYSINTKGKRLRPLICMLCSEVLEGNYKDTINAFIALELIHNGTLVHDDIIDDDTLRRGKTSVHIEYGAKRAILAGDILLSMSLKYASKTGKIKIIDKLSETAINMVQGVALQTLYRRQLISGQKYMELAYLKSGSLFEAAAVLGALVISDDEFLISKFENFGKNFGIAYQIRDDIIDILHENENQTRSDIMNGDLSLPFIIALESDKIAIQDREWLEKIFKGEIKEFDESKLLNIYEKTDAINISIEKMNHYAETSRESLSHFNKNKALDCLKYLIDSNYTTFRFQSVIV